MHITIGSMNRNGEVSAEVLKAAGSAERVVLQTSKGLEKLPDISFSTLDDIYENAVDFDELASCSVEFLMSDGTLFICLGDACHSSIAVKLAAKVTENGGTVKVIPYGSEASALALQSGIIKKASGITFYTASSFDFVTNTDNVLVIEEVDSSMLASDLKLNLAKYYDDEHKVLFINTSTHTYNIIPLYKLDTADYYGHYCAVVIAPVQFEEKKRYTFSDLVSVMDKLRSRNGCPWDKEQTHFSLKRYLVEESYEVLEAIDEGDMNALYDELGDVILQVVFHAKIAQQNSEFDISDVTSAICEKMISRHSHIFGSAVAHTPGDVIDNWEVIKKQEKSHQTQTDVLKAVPKSMPALFRSGKIQHKAAHIGFDFEQPGQAVEKLREEILEIEQDLAAGKDPAEECGDMLFSAVNVVRLLGIEPEITLQNATDKFIRRFEYVEKLALKRNIDMKKSSLETLDVLWEEAKTAAD